MKKVYLLRWGAFGDSVHMSNVIRAFKQDGWHVTCEYNYKGAQIHAHNPRIDVHHVFEPSKDGTNMKKRFYQFIRAKQEMIKKEYDHFVNFSHSIEDALIEPERKSSYFWPLKMRRQKNAHICYYDQSMIWAGLTDKKYMGGVGEIWFTREEHNHVWNQLRPYRDRFIILWAMRGTMWQKAVCHIAKDIVNEWLEANPDTVVITTGDDFCQKWEWVSSVGTTMAPKKGLGDGTPTLIHKSGRMPFRQALNIARYADLVVTPETGLGIGAGAMSTPKIMLLTAASIKNIVGNDKNDYSLQSDAWCSPCTRAIYNTRNCPVNKETNLPICVDFDKDRVLARMKEVRDNHGLYNLQSRYDTPSKRPVYL